LGDVGIVADITRSRRSPLETDVDGFCVEGEWDGKKREKKGEGDHDWGSAVGEAGEGKRGWRNKRKEVE
jgi:hypothetical protein